VELQPVHFYVPAVLALLLQHIAISLAGLSIVNERFAGTMELMRAAPVNAFEVLLGKYVSFLVFLGFLAAALTALVHWGLGVPLLGDWAIYALTVFLVILVSLGFGFLISTLARSDSQAIQFSMVLLLASIFFSGFLMPLYRLGWPALSISWAMPVTYGLMILQDIMLRGAQPEAWLLWVLGGLGMALFLASWLRLRSLMVQN
jgi:ABC-2 type transport system permease protein